MIPMEDDYKPVQAEEPNMKDTASSDSEVANAGQQMSSTGLQLEQLANKNQLTIRIKWTSAIINDEQEKDNIITEFSNVIIRQKGNIINPLKIENYEYLSDLKRLDIIKENNYEFEHGSREFAKSYEDEVKNWMFDVVIQAHFRKGYSLENCATYVSNMLKSMADNIERWSITINHHALTHPGNLFIGGISKVITINRLIDIFKQYGPLVSIKLIHDKTKENDIGYGFVSYQLGSQASHCIQNLNGKEIEGSSLFINYHVDRKERETLHWNQVKENSDEKNFKCLFMGNLPKKTEDGTLVTQDMVLSLIQDKIKEKIPEFKIVSYYFPKEANKSQKESLDSNTLKGYGFIKLESHEEVLQIIEEFNGYEWHGAALVVNKAVQNRVQSSNHNGSSHHNNGAGSLNASRNFNGIFQDKSIVASTGTNVNEPQVNQYMNHIYPNYYGDPASITASPEMVGSMPIGGDISPPMLASPPTLNGEYTYETPGILPAPYMNTLPIPLNNQQESNLYIKHIPLDWTDSALSEFYEGFGRIISAKIITIGGSHLKDNSDNSDASLDGVPGAKETDGAGSSKGYGFVCFENPLDASRAILATNGYQLGNGSILSVSFANKKSNGNGSGHAINLRDDIRNKSPKMDDNRNGGGPEGYSQKRKGSNNSNGSSTHLSYNKKFMNALMQQQGQILVNSPMAIPQAPMQNFPMYMRGGMNNPSFFPMSSYNAMPFQYPRP